MTELTVLQQKFAALKCELKYHEPLRKHTSFRIGGPVEVMACPADREELADVLKLCRTLSVKPLILGAGTNVLAPDEGLDGIVVCLKDCLGGMEQLDRNHIRVMA